MYFSEQQGLMHSRETLLVWWGTPYSHCPAPPRDLWPLALIVDEAYSGWKCGCWQSQRSSRDIVCRCRYQWCRAALDQVCCISNNTLPYEVWSVPLSNHNLPKSVEFAVAWSNTRCLQTLLYVLLDSSCYEVGMISSTIHRVGTIFSYLHRKCKSKF